jgi:hypothetical protein
MTNGALTIKDLCLMEIHQCDYAIENSPGDEVITSVMRVYGGWIYSFENNVKHVDYVFVPYRNAPEFETHFP